MELPDDGDGSRRLIHFGGLGIVYDDGVLEPRPWTIEQSRWAIELLADLPDGPVLELGAGAGQIGLVVAAETGRRVVQVDDDPHACALARLNARRAGIETEVRCGEPADAVAGDEQFVLTIADPPYVPDGVGHAVNGGPDGLDVARAWLPIAARHSDTVLLQIGGQHQADTIVAEFDAFDHLETRVFRADRALVLLRAQRE